MSRPNLGGCLFSKTRKGQYIIHVTGIADNDNDSAHEELDYDAVSQEHYTFKDIDNVTKCTCQ